MSLSLNLESEWNFGETIASLYKGWFVPPADGRYRFYMTCDDKCKIEMASCPNTITPLTTLLDHDYYNNYRDYFAARNYEVGGRKTWSEWIELKKGEHYYLVGSHAEGYGGDSFSVAVEIEQSAIKNHHHSMKEI